MTRLWMRLIALRRRIAILRSKGAAMHKILKELETEIDALKQRVWKLEKRQNDISEAAGKILGGWDTTDEQKPWDTPAGE